MKFIYCLLKDPSFRILMCFGVLIIVFSTFIPFDDTDDSYSKTRSGLTMYTDYGTGCQYVKGGLFGGTTPRLSKNGNHICE